MAFQCPFIIFSGQYFTGNFLFVHLSFRVLILVALNLILDFLVLLKQEPKHLIELFTGLESYFLVCLHGM